MNYKAPVENMSFLLNQVFNLKKSLAEIECFSEFDEDLYLAVLEEAAKFSETVLYPINRSGDEEGCLFNDGEVTTPKGFKDAYSRFCEGGWQGLSGDPEYGGQGLPKTLHILVEEILYSANTSFCLYPSLTNGAYHAIKAHACEILKKKFLPAMLDGKWSGAMGLTEPHAGSDLGLIKTRAEKSGEGAYRLNGTKIFITGGEHDLSENIIHLVLARLPGAPAGAKGISLFLVPRHKVNEDLSIGENNGVSCGSIEHKMGIKASSTCVMNFDEAEGFLIGEENRGLNAMFTMMNLERLSIGIQGIGLAETSYQLSKAYALERKQGKGTSSETVAIIEHADVRRMLLEQRVYTESNRAMAMFLGVQIDTQYHHPDEEKRIRAAQLVALLTPVAKAFFTDKGFESCNHGVQVLGGHGYIREWGLEQLVRDSKIAQIYEGTNGIQASDFLLRKVCLDKQVVLGILFDMINQELSVDTVYQEATELNNNLCSALKIFKGASDWLNENFDHQRTEIQGAAVDYLHAAGYLVSGWMWLKMLNALNNELNEDFIAGKLLAGQYFGQRLPSRMQELCSKVMMSYENIMSVPDKII